LAQLTLRGAADKALQLKYQPLCDSVVVWFLSYVHLLAVAPEEDSHLVWLQPESTTQILEVKQLQGRTSAVQGTPGTFLYTG